MGTVIKVQIYLGTSMGKIFINMYLLYKIKRSLHIIYTRFTYHLYNGFDMCRSTYMGILKVKKWLLLTLHCFSFVFKRLSSSFKLVVKLQGSYSHISVNLSIKMSHITDTSGDNICCKLKILLVSSMYFKYFNWSIECYLVGF